LASECRSSGGEIFPYMLDVTDEPDVCRVVERIEADLGPIDLAILNAGTFVRFGAQDFSVADFRKQIDVNLMGCVHGLGAVLPSMLRRGSGHIAVMGSLAGYRGLPKAAAYGATKAALINMCEALYPECRKAGITISVINPGFVKTPLTDLNEFSMPFLIEADEAAKRIVRGLERGAFDIAFPSRFAWIMKCFRILPDRLFFALTKRMLG
jgi:short-subunit dehydrogenase